MLLTDLACLVTVYQSKRSILCIMLLLIILALLIHLYISAMLAWFLLLVCSGYCEYNWTVGCMIETDWFISPLLSVCMGCVVFIAWSRCDHVNFSAYSSYTVWQYRYSPHIHGLALSMILSPDVNNVLIVTVSLVNCLHLSLYISFCHCITWLSGSMAPSLVNIPPCAGRVSTILSGVVLCGWGIKAGMAHVWSQVRLCEPSKTCHTFAL